MRRLTPASSTQDFRLLALLLLFVMLPVQQVHSQSATCSFSEDDVVADTLDPQGYYPLEVGNIWEYVTDVSGFLEELSREEIVGDTLIDGITFYMRRVTRYDPEQRPITTIKSQSIDFIAAQDSTLLFWEENFGILEQEIRFNHSFQACYEGSFMAIGETTVEVTGEYDFQFTIEEQGVSVQYPLLSWKSFIIGVAGSQRYGYSIGKIRAGADVGVASNLVYAKVGEQEYGTPLDSLFDIRVATEERPVVPRQQIRLSSYPNPFRSTAHLTFSLPSPAQVTLRISDVLGRVVARPFDGEQLPPGVHRVAWDAVRLPAGLYLAQVVVGGQPVASTMLTLIR